MRHRNFRTAPFAFFTFLGVIGLMSRTARADDLELDHLAAGAIKLDGKLKEWPSAVVATSSVKAGKGAATFNAGYDDQGIWVGADVVKETAIARTAAFSATEDCVGLILAFPKSGVATGVPDYVAYEIGLYAGIPGTSAGSVRVRSSGKVIEGAKIVEAKGKTGGYTLEAFIPWSAFAEAKKTRVGMRGDLRAYVSDGAQIVAIKATSNGSVDAHGALGRFLIEPEQSIPNALASKKLAWKDIGFDVIADVAGDGTNERLLISGRNLFLFGPTYKEGKQWLAMDLGVDVVGVEARDLTLDGHVDLLVTTRVKAAGTVREALTVYAFAGDKGAEKATRIFSHETLIESASGTLRDAVVFGSVKGKPTATATYATAKGWDAATYKEPIATDVDPILFPWGSVKQREFVFATSPLGFVKDKEVAQKPTVVTPTPTPTPTSTKPMTPPTPVKQGDPAFAGFALYRKDKSLAATTSPRFEQVLDIGSGKQGRAALFGRDLVVTSNDGSYAFVTMARFATDKDVIEVTTKDISPDDRGEIIVRGIVRGKATIASGEKEVLREVIAIYAPKIQGSAVSLVPVFNAEVARSIDSDRVDSTVTIVPAKGTTSGKIVITKGAAKGWTQTTYPFASETPTVGLEPLVLPWSKETSITYAWNGERFAR